MSQENIERIIGKILLDTNFREVLLSNPDKALKDFELSRDEIFALKHIDAETMEALANVLNTYILKRQIPGFFTDSSNS